MEKDKESINAPNICGECGEEITGETFRLTNEKETFRLCNKCYDKVTNTLNEQKANINYPLAIILGLLFGIAGGLVWFGIVVLTKWEFGLVAVLAGYLAGWGVYFGSGKKKTINLQIISCVIALISILIGEYFITNYFAYKYLIEQGVAVTGYLLSPIKIMPIVFASIKDDPLTLLFWGIAVYAAFFVTKPVRLRKV